MELNARKLRPEYDGLKVTGNQVKAEEFIPRKIGQEFGTLAGPASSRDLIGRNLDPIANHGPVLVECRLLMPKTLNHPAFPFTIHPSQTTNPKITSGWCEFLKVQSADKSRPSFVLHDGPPYANGRLHVGHALNKFLKDITVRYKLLCGYSVDFIPGWDCHGLPIELKAIEQSTKCTPQETRTQASLVAHKYIDLQKSTFMDWGILADWSKYYSTMDHTFEKSEIDAFAMLHSKACLLGRYSLAFRGLFIAIYSLYTGPAERSERISLLHLSLCRTALAESELEYNCEHVSPSVYIRVPLFELSLPLSRTVSGLSSVYGVVWTTTPWTLPANEAIVYDPNARYALLKSMHSGDIYIVSGQFSQQLSSMLPGADLKQIEELPGPELLRTCRYLHPIRSITSNSEDNLCPFLPGTYVSETKGTGLVHCAPCHGKEDFLLGQSFHLPMNQLVDDEGCFIPEAGCELAGLRLDDEGTAKILELVRPMLVHQGTIKHSYPYDWRTKTPVITRLSEQWFLDTSALSTAAIEAYNSVDVIPPKHKPSMLPFISSRPRWCISRQRSWGVPIPVLLRKEDGKPIVDQEFIQCISERVAHCGTDFWFNESLETLVPERFWKKWNVSPSGVIKSTDVFDVWFDSGLSWLGVLCKDGSHSLNGKTKTVADLYLEGQDQFRGWFSSSLLLSVALQNCAPYKTLVVHGMTADSEGRKMSKSLGNVVSPEDLLNQNKGCVDILRRWAACSALDSISTVGNKEMNLHSASYRALRNSLRFMLGNLVDFSPISQLAYLRDTQAVKCTNVNQLIFDIIEATSPSSQCQKPGALNCTVLYWLGCLVKSARSEYYPTYRFNALLSEVDQLLSRLSSMYITAVKDILYCDPVDSFDRRMVQTIFLVATESLKMLLSPIMPYLMEECEEAIQRSWKSYALMPSTSHTRSLLERYSLNTLYGGLSSNMPTSDWSTCLSAIEHYASYATLAHACETVHAFYLSIINQMSSELNLNSAPVNPLVGKHVRLHLDPCSETASLQESLQMLHPTRTLGSANSELCRLFRAGSVSWSFGDDARTTKEQDPDIHILSVPYQGSVVRVRLSTAPPDTRCPRCMRFTLSPPAALCIRCELALMPQATETSRQSAP
ncbi:hypothetical protein T265_08843 [Opisthorchis viverrini]|uniref:isoleucine--tRNA ligase n=2 Tax=Opisthorchis viverrini TaxID=6198 RepID=A0A074Z7S2_OPIVI|nr:hypothetical protein T265_08843 [Opisthorchis viverrini]KER23231.1 hypothetical protein T265_08843 [Opisthorchis viverrini]